MKRLMLMGATATLMLLTSCGGDECYRCRKNSYFNGISYTDPGPWTVQCKKDGESDSDFEERINQKKGNGFTCEEK